MKKPFFTFLFLLLAGAGAVYALPTDPPTPRDPLDLILNTPNPEERFEQLNLHSQFRILFFLSALTLIPFVLVMMTSFTRITIVLQFVRQALATQQVPSNQIIVGLSLILTAFVMQPVFREVEQKALTPYLAQEFRNEPEVKMGAKGEDTLFFERAWDPMRRFMLQHTREKDLILFLEIGNVELPKIELPDVTDPNASDNSAYDLAAIPWFCIIPSFVLSELRTAFMMGFLLFLPFLVIDMVVASILMSMGMMMLPPVMISMPFKLLLFILVDGWRIIMQQTVNGFYPMG